jgi:hypothetical protein
VSDPTPIHWHPVAQVQQEMGHSRSAFYKRMSLAGVVPTRIGQNSFLSPEQVHTLKALEAHVQKGGSPETFPGRLQTSPERSLVPVDPPAFSVPEGSAAVSALVEGLVASAVQHLDGLLSFLTKASRNRWELPTSQLELLVGARPRGSSFSRYGFTFRAVGRHGQETSWRVER